LPLFLSRVNHLNFGAALIGMGVLGNLTTHSNLIWYAALRRLILSAIGKCLTALFVADANQVKNFSHRVNNVENSTTTIPKL
jgi:hypothetical protein